MVLDLQRIGISRLSEMQEQVQRTFEASETDIVLLSPTGSGKTLAYLLPLLQQVEVDSEAVQVIVIVPSRELAVQTDGVVKQLKTSVRSTALHGGRPTMDEHRLYRAQHPHIVIATPGRLLDHLQKGNLQVDAVRMLILDEFDKCLELGFHQQLQDILQYLPTVQRRILLSATDSSQIPSFVNLSTAVRLDYLHTEQRAPVFTVDSPQKDKLQTLYELLCTLGSEQTIVFLNHRDAVERTTQFLRHKTISCEQYYGSLDQEHRERALYKFMNGTSNVLVSTDLGSRGLDYPDVDNIVHYHLPVNQDTYIHRNGRTARGVDFDEERKAGRIFFILHEEETLPEYATGSSVKPYYIPRQLPSVAQPRMATIYIGKGKKDKISRGDILGLLCKVCGLDSQDIGRIDVREHCSYAAITRSLLHSTLLQLEGQKVKGIRTIFREAR